MDEEETKRYDNCDGMLDFEAEASQYMVRDRLIRICASSDAVGALACTANPQKQAQCMKLVFPNFRGDAGNLAR